MNIRGRIFNLNPTEESVEIHEGHSKGMLDTNVLERPVLITLGSKLKATHKS